jgi:hypothetical protein
VESKEFSNLLEKNSPCTNLESGWDWYPQHLEELVLKTDVIVGEFLTNQGHGLVCTIVTTAFSCMADGVV